MDSESDCPENVASVATYWLPALWIEYGRSARVSIGAEEGMTTEIGAVRRPYSAPAMKTASDAAAVSTARTAIDRRHGPSRRSDRASPLSSEAALIVSPRLDRTHPCVDAATACCRSRLRLTTESRMRSSISSAGNPGKIGRASCRERE